MTHRPPAPAPSAPRGNSARPPVDVAPAPAPVQGEVMRYTYAGISSGYHTFKAPAGVKSHTLWIPQGALTQAPAPGTVIELEAPGLKFAAPPAGADPAVLKAQADKLAARAARDAEKAKALTAQLAALSGSKAPRVVKAKAKAKAKGQAPAVQTTTQAPSQADTQAPSQTE